MQYRLMKKAIFIISLILLSSPLWAFDNPDAILGVWKNSTGKGYVQIYKQNGKYFGKITWLKNAVDANGHPKLDKKNQDPAQRNKPLIGLVMLRNFVYEDGEWTDGHIYNPQDGKEYKGYMRLKDNNTLIVRGYIGLSWFGKSDVWTRVN